MAGLKHIASPLGRFIGGACALVGGASAGTAASAAVAGTGVALTGPAAIGILAVLAAFAGGAAFYKGVTARNADGTSDEILQRLTKLTREHRSLSRALALLPDDIPAGSAEVAQRIRTLGAVFADDDPQRVAGRLAGEPELAAFLETETRAREDADDQVRMGLNALIDEAIEQGRFRPDVIEKLSGIDAKLDTVLDGQDRVEAKVDSITDYLLTQNQSLHAENRELAVDNEGLRTQLRAAVERVAQAETAAGRDPMVRLEELRQGDAHDLLAFLDEQIDKDELDLIEKHRERAAVAFLVGQVSKAEASLRKVLALKPNDISAINEFGHIHRLRGHLDDAEKAYRRVLELAGEDRGSQAAASGNLGIVLKTRGDLDGAEGMHRTALAIDEERGCKEGMASHYGNLGIVLMTRGDLDGAEAMYRNALAIHEDLGHKEGMASDCGNLGVVLMTRGDSDGAEAMHRKSLAINETLGRKAGMASDYGNLGVILKGRGDLDGAEAMYRKALAIGKELGSQERIAIQYANLGIVLKSRGDPDGAEAMYRKALAINEELGRKDGMAINLGNLGLILMHRGDLNGAEAMYRTALAINEELGSKEGMATNSANLGIIAAQRGDVPEARRLWTLARDLFAEIGAKPNLEQIQGWLDELPPP